MPPTISNVSSELFEGSAEEVKQPNKLQLEMAVLDNLINTDIAAIEAKLEALKLAPASTQVWQKPNALPYRRNFRVL